jgi:transcriptional regulator with XRE-family HTH domain
VDVHVGRRLRLRRTLLGMSQEKLGEAIGLTFQQVQKYERGSNRIGASRLFDLSRVLDVPVGFFFEDMSDDVAAQSPGRARGRVQPVEFPPSPMTRRETLEFVRAYYKIHDVDIRRRLFEMVKERRRQGIDPAPHCGRKRRLFDSVTPWPVVRAGRRRMCLTDILPRRQHARRPGLFPAAFTLGLGQARIDLGPTWSSETSPGKPGP